MRRRNYSKMAAYEDIIMDYDSVEPLFFGDDMDDEFYDDNLTKDLFKKFELLPTPPRSPKHEPFPPDIVETAVEKRLQLVSQVLDDTDPISRTMILPILNEDCECYHPSNLIQDCMWSAPGLLAAGLLSPADIKKAGAKALCSLSTPIPSSGCDKKDCSRKRGAPVDVKSNECVDPAAVFPYPVSSEAKKTCLLLKATQSLLGESLGSVAETPSPSESEDEEEEEEEIDVVTVDKTQRHRRTNPATNTVYNKAAASFSAHVATMHNYSNTTGNPASSSYSAPQSPSSSNSSSHHCHKRSRPISMPGSPQPISKRARSMINSTDLKKVVQKLKQEPSHHHSYHHHHSHISHSASTSQSPSSDSDDSCDGNKRAQHNVLERKRRNDLKYSFLRLKDQVPDLNRQDRAAKVVILRKSADYIHSLRASYNSLTKEEEKQRRLHEHLLRKLSQLRRECY